MASGRRPYGAWGEQPACPHCHHRRIMHRRMVTTGATRLARRQEFVVPCSAPRGNDEFCGCIEYPDALTIERSVV